jgi:hypothetical protein
LERRISLFKFDRAVLLLDDEPWFGDRGSVARGELAREEWLPPELRCFGIGSGLGVDRARMLALQRRLRTT